MLHSIPIRAVAAAVRSSLSPALSKALQLGLLLTVFCLVASPALAHHPFGGQAPINALQGFLSGLGHPVIGLDHFAFIVTVGLLAASMGRGLSLPIVFVLASLGGTGLHLMAANLPASELVIAASVLLFGGFLTMKQHPRLALLLGLSIVSGLFHGYAYGEAVVGAKMMPLVAYLLGFTVIQMAIAATAYEVAQRWLKPSATHPSLALRFAGFSLAGIGAAFLSAVVLG